MRRWLLRASFFEVSSCRTKAVYCGQPTRMREQGKSGLGSADVSRKNQFVSALPSPIQRADAAHQSAASLPRNTVIEALGRVYVVAAVALISDRDAGPSGSAEPPVRVGCH